MALISDQVRKPPSDAAIVERIVGAVMEQKLPPGAKLSEAVLCDIFECSRTQIRRILVVLSERGVVALHANRGAFVSTPDAAAAREVFEARRAIERSIMLSAATCIDRAALKELRANVVAGAAAEARGDRSELIRLSGRFHLRMAEVAGNSVLTKFLEELVARTSLIIALYGSRGDRSCSEVQHKDLIDALDSRDGARAAEEMERHLRHIEHTLDIREVAEQPADLWRAFVH